MAAVLKEHAVPVAAGPPVVIVGAGPSGVRVAQELTRRDPDAWATAYGVLASTMKDAAAKVPA